MKAEALPLRIAAGMVLLMGCMVTALAQSRDRQSLLVISPEVQSDRRVIFRLLAPK